MSLDSNSSCTLISHGFWNSELDRKMREKGAKARLLALYLVSNPHLDAEADYPLPVAVMAEEIGLSLNGTGRLLRQLVELGFCRYDETTGTVHLLERGFWKAGGAA